MAPNRTSAATSSTTVPSAPELFASLAGIVARHANEQMTALARRLVATMLEVTDGTLEAGAVYRRVKSGNLLKNNSYAFIHLAASALERAVGKEMAFLAPAPAKARPAAAAAAALSLVPFEEMDSRVAFGTLSEPFEMRYAGQLATLNVRLGMLLGRDTLRMAQNPFRPEVFLMAIDQAWREFDPDQDAHALILTLLRPSLLFDFAPLYEALNLALMRKGARPDAPDAMRIRKAEHAAAARAARAGTQAALSRQLRQFLGGNLAGNGPADGFIDAIPLIPEMPHLPQGQSGWRPSGAPGFERAPAAPGEVHGTPGAPLLDLLARLQQDPPAPAAGAVASPHNVFYLPRLKESLPKGSLSRGEEGTIDLLSRIFETVFVDENIPRETRELIQYLQIPVLKAALRDQDFFYEEAHPARRMIDLLSRMGWEQQRTGADDPLFLAMRRSVDRVGRDAQQAPAAFAEAVAELEARIASEETSAAEAMSEPIARALRQEKAGTAAKSARTAVALRIGQGDCVPVIETFLENKWTDVLALAYSVEPDKPGAVGNAIEAMDQLIWSVKPKVTQEQRRALIGKLPGLLSMLNKWLDVIRWQDAARLQFFAELAECHASIVRAPLDLSPARQLEIALEVAQQDAVRRIEKENAAAREEDAFDHAAVTVDGLERGMWLEFTQPDAGVRKVKLAWISPLRTLYIFSTGARQETFSMSSEKLAEAYRHGSVRVPARDGVVARALSDAMGQGAVDDGAIVRRQSASA